jgi:hypothetical protein
MGRNTVEFTFDFLIEAVWDVTTSRYLAGCAATLVIYDWLLLIDDESRTIWRSHWTLPKTLYYFVSTLLILICFLDWWLILLADPDPYSTVHWLCCVWYAPTTLSHIHLFMLSC